MEGDTLLRSLSLFELSRALGASMLEKLELFSLEDIFAVVRAAHVILANNLIA